MRSWWFSVLLGLVSIALYACQPSTTETFESPLPFESPMTSSETTPSPVSAPTLEIPTPSSGLSVVAGRLVATSPSGRALLSGDIYLAPVQYAEGGTEPFPYIRLDPDQDAKATLRNEQGEFVILAVQPGSYGLVIHTPVSDYVVPDGEGGFLVLELEPDQLVDVGSIELQ